MPLLFIGVVVFAISDNTHELIAGGPFLLFMAFGFASLIFGGTNIEVDESGFRLRPGPLPSGLPKESHARTEVKHLFPRHVHESVGKNVWEERYYAAVELNDGRWLNVRGHYPGWDGASAACQEIARFWGFQEIAAGRSGYSDKRDWNSARVVLLWGGALIAALVWGLVAEISGLRI